jgi:hypothetical protein
MRCGLPENGVALFESRAKGHLRNSTAIGHRFMFERVMAGKSACTFTTPRHRRPHSLSSRRAEGNHNVEEMVARRTRRARREKTNGTELSRISDDFASKRLPPSGLCSFDISNRESGRIFQSSYGPKGQDSLARVHPGLIPQAEGALKGPYRTARIGPRPDRAHFHPGAPFKG